MTLVVSISCIRDTQERHARVHIVGQHAVKLILESSFTGGQHAVKLILESSFTGIYTIQVQYFNYISYIFVVFCY
jgi:hypothetical protein